MRDTVNPEFATYVDARQGRWFRAAYLVYGDLRRAETELLRAFVQLSTRWQRIEDPDLYAQQELYRAAVPRWTRLVPANWSRSHWTQLVPEGWRQRIPKRWQEQRPSAEEAEPVKAALTDMSAVQRAVFVLVHLEELTEFEVSEILGMSPNAVHGHALSAFALFRSSLGVPDWRDVGRWEGRSQ